MRRRGHTARGASRIRIERFELVPLDSSEGLLRLAGTWRLRRWGGPPSFTLVVRTSQRRTELEPLPDPVGPAPHSWKAAFPAGPDELVPGPDFALKIGGREVQLAPPALRELIPADTLAETPRVTGEDGALLEKLASLREAVREGSGTIDALEHRAAVLRDAIGATATIAWPTSGPIAEALDGLEDLERRIDAVRAALPGATPSRSEAPGADVVGRLAHARVALAGEAERLGVTEARLALLRERLVEPD